MEPPTLSVVAPVYNEARILSEFVARCTRAAEQCGRPFELVLVDDASTDATPELLATLRRDERVRSLRLASNAGQFRATQAGLRAARGDWVVVLDADLQDPPEHIPRLVDALAAADTSVSAVLAVKSHRDDPLPFMVGQFLFHRLQQLLSRVVVPSGAGTYCVMRQPVARRVARAQCPRANLAAVVAVAVRALGGELDTLAYEKGARYDRRGHVGWLGLIAEALDSLAVTGALPRVLALLAVGFAGGALLFAGHSAARAVLLASGSVAAVGALSVSRRARQRLAAVHAPDSDAG